MTIAWLADLEERVHAATARIEELQQENSQLTAKVEELEKELRETPSGQQLETLIQEKEEVRERVGKLVEHLAGLLRG